MFFFVFDVFALVCNGKKHKNAIINKNVIGGGKTPAMRLQPLFSASIKQERRVA